MIFWRSQAIGELTFKLLTAWPGLSLACCTLHPEVQPALSDRNIALKSALPTPALGCWTLAGVPPHHSLVFPDSSHIQKPGWRWETGKVGPDRWESFPALGIFDSVKCEIVKSAQSCRSFVLLFFFFLPWLFVFRPVLVEGTVTLLWDKPGFKVWVDVSVILGLPGSKVFASEQDWQPGG